VSQTVEFFFSPSSRYSYLAASQVSKLEREFDCTVVWRPVHGPDIRTLRGRDPFIGPPPSGQYEWSYREADAEAWADFYGIPFHEPRSHDFDSRLLVQAAAASRELDRVAEYSWELSSEVYGRRAWPIDEALCLRVARATGLDSRRFADLLCSSRTDQAVESSAREAFERGAFGVPTFFVNVRMLWGNDRLPLVRHALAKASSNA
jgi:2-hydroxychromene-2-carboxylate isomerase